jgi:DNA-binding HxlR family transcriptional regulator
MALGKDYDGQDCSLARALEIVGERWTMLIVRDAFYGVRRFSDFLAHLELPRAVLAGRLHTLVEAGVLEKRQYQGSPPRDEYLLTGRGRDLWPAVYGLAQWGERHQASGGPRGIFIHAECGARIERAGTCPACRRWVPPEELEMRPGPGATACRNDPVSQALARPHRLLEPLP